MDCGEAIQDHNFVALKELEDYHLLRSSLQISREFDDLKI